MVWVEYAEIQRGYEIYVEGVHVRVWKDEEGYCWYFYIYMDDAGPHHNGVIEGNKETARQAFSFVQYVLMGEGFEAPLPENLIKRIEEED